MKRTLSRRLFDAGMSYRFPRCASPQSQSEPRIGPSDRPSGVSEYSTLGGMTG